MAGRATWSRMNTTIASIMFHHRPRGGLPEAIRCPTGTNTAIITAAAANSKTMNLVVWSPKIWGRCHSTPIGKWKVSLSFT